MKGDTRRGTEESDRWMNTGSECWESNLLAGYAIPIEDEMKRGGVWKDGVLIV